MVDGKGAVAAIGWLAFWGSALVGAWALIVALDLALRGDKATAGVFLIAAAVAFGLLGNTIHRS